MDMDSFPEPGDFDRWIWNIKKKAEEFAALFPDALSLVEALLAGVGDTLDDLIDDDLGGAA